MNVTRARTFSVLLIAVVSSLASVLIVNDGEPSRGAPARAPSVQAEAVTFNAHGLRKPLSEVELTQKADLVIIGRVDAKAYYEFATDPWLPSNSMNDPVTAELGESGAGQTRWTVSITEIVKGSASSPVYVVLGGEAGVGASGSEVYVDKSDTGGTSQVDPGKLYKMWLMPDSWFQQNHWVLQRAVEVVS